LKYFLSSPPLGSYFLTAKSNKNSRLPIFLSKEVHWLIGTSRKIGDRKLVKRRFERLSLAVVLKEIEIKVLNFVNLICIALVKIDKVGGIDLQLPNPDVSKTDRFTWITVIL